MRTLLNSHQLVQECNSFKDWVLDPMYKSVQCRCRALTCWCCAVPGKGGWRVAGGGGGWHGAAAGLTAIPTVPCLPTTPACLPALPLLCRHTSFTSDNEQNMATVRGADLLVVVHGSGCAMHKGFDVTVRLAVQIADAKSATEVHNWEIAKWSNRRCGARMR